MAWPPQTVKTQGIPPAVLPPISLLPLPPLPRRHRVSSQHLEKNEGGLFGRRGAYVGKPTPSLAYTVYGFCAE